MIKANELRIGNWVDYDFVTTELRGYTKITRDLMHDLLEHGTDDIHIINPIPLSPELLEKCGFDYDYDHSEKWFSSQIGYIGKCEGGYTLPDPDGEPSIGYVIESLHQLQNLYFCLCGEELEVKM